MIAVIRMMTARRITPGVRLTRDVPDGQGGFRAAEPATVTAVDHQADRRLLIRLDVGVTLLCHRTLRLERALDGVSRKGNQP